MGVIWWNGEREGGERLYGGGRGHTAIASSGSLHTPLLQLTVGNEVHPSVKDGGRRGDVQTRRDRLHNRVSRLCLLRRGHKLSIKGVNHYGTPKKKKKKKKKKTSEG